MTRPASTVAPSTVPDSTVAAGDAVSVVALVDVPDISQPDPFDVREFARDRTEHRLDPLGRGSPHLCADALRQPEGPRTIIRDDEWSSGQP